MQSLIRLKNLNVHYGSKPILKSLNVDMPLGAIGLLGPNGAGKSTLIKTLMGFVKNKNGSAEVMGHNCAKEGAKIRQLIGYMPEDDTYIPGMSAVEFVAYCGKLCGLPSNEAMLRAHQVLHYCGLGEARYRKVDGYSTGMRQRIKLAQALVHDPKLLLLDEPTNGLDPQGRKHLLELIADISKNKNISVLLSSHLLPDVEMVCEHVMVLFQGRIAQAGQISDLKKMAHTSYEVRIKGDLRAFQDAIAEQSGKMEEKKDGLYRIALSDGAGPETIFTAAKNSATQIRQLTQEEMTLQEIFSSAIQSVEQDQKLNGK